MRRFEVGSLWAGADRLRRRCGFDRNDLRRNIDRRQRSVAIGLILLYLAAAPAAVLQSAQGTYDRGIRAERHEKTTRHTVTATVVAPGSQHLSMRRPTRVSWTEPDGRRRTGTTYAWRGQADRGETQRMWVDSSGQPTVRPRRRTQTIADAWLAGLGTSLGVAVPLLVTYTAVRRRNDRRRYQDWDHAWARLDRRHAG